MLKIYLIAGEASGDNIGAKLIKALKEKDPNIQFFGIGGSNMEKQGLNSLFPMKDLSLMGFFEIIFHLPKLLFRIYQTIKHICLINPDLLITIDSPGFCFRVAQKVKNKISGKLIHYVAPTVWAYKPERAKKIAKIYDHLLVILPFEPEYFLKENLTTDFVGYPAIEDLKIMPKSLFRKKFNISEEELLLCITPGSREQEIKTLLPIFITAIDKFTKTLNRKVKIACLTQSHLKPLIEKIVSNKLNIIFANQTDKQELFSSADVALTKSGTITTELAFYKIPMIVAHKINPLSYLFLKRIILIKYVTIINILAGKPLVPELLQEGCNADSIADKLIEYSAQDKINLFKEEIADNLAKLTLEGKAPSVIAAEKVLSYLSCTLK